MMGADTTRISVTATAEILRAPDRVVVFVEIAANDESGQLAALANGQTRNDVLEAQVEDWSGAEPRTWTQSSRLGAEGKWLSSEPQVRALQADSESRNAAIFAESLGMTTGALPKVDAISSPLGAFSSPV